MTEELAVDDGVAGVAGSGGLDGESGQRTRGEALLPLLWLLKVGEAVAARFTSFDMRRGAGRAAVAAEPERPTSCFRAAKDGVWRRLGDGNVPLFSAGDAGDCDAAGVYETDGSEAHGSS